MDPQPTFSLVDTHCHLNFNDFDADRAQVVQRARQSGIQRILVPGIDLETSRSALELAGQIPEVFAAVGIHPNSGLMWSTGLLDEVRCMAQGAKVVAIGEIGLDYYRQPGPYDLQRSIFRQQLELAAELDLPVVIHNREASADLLEILTVWHQTLVEHGSKIAGHPGVLHSYSASEQLARAAFNLDFKLGITGPLTFPKAQQLQGVVTALPLEALLLETDAPYQAPIPFRGKRNEPANVRIVAEKIAELKQAPVEVVARVTTESANQLFDWRTSL